MAVNFTEDGITVYVDGNPVPNSAWTRRSKAISTHPVSTTRRFCCRTRNPGFWAPTNTRPKLNETAQEFATDDDNLIHEFEGAIADFGIWGGFTADDALSRAEIQDLIANGPGAALTNPSGAQPMILADDVINGMAGNDVIDGEGGDDTLSGGTATTASRAATATTT